MKAHTKETQAAITSENALNLLKEGNSRFQNNTPLDRDLLGQVSDTSKGQYPFATILSCIDSRVSSEIIFDNALTHPSTSEICTVKPALFDSITSAKASPVVETVGNPVQK